jgi:hypothetical protein
MMNPQSISKARSFVAVAELPAPPPIDFDIAKAPAAALDAAKEQAAVVGGEVIAFVKGVTAEQRADIVNASLLAQLVAKKKVPGPTTLAGLTAWYDSYFDVLSNIGFAIQDKGFAEYHETSDSFQAHEAILEVAAVLMAGSPAALALVNTTLKALQKMDEGSPWITLFNRESQSANTARFQIGLAEANATDGLLLSLMSFGLEARSNVTQVLFFKFRKNDMTLQHHSGKVTINAALLAAVRLEIAARLVAFAHDYVQRLPDLS